MRVTPPGDGNNGKKGFKVINGERDPRVPVLGKGTPYAFWGRIGLNFTEKIDYISNVVAKHVGAAKDFNELVKLSFDWAEQLFGLNPTKQNYYVALIMVNDRGGLEIKSSRGIFDATTLDLNSPNSFVSYSFNRGETIYFPNIFQATPEGEREFRHLVDTTSMAMFHSQSGVEINQLLRISNDKHCFLAAPLKHENDKLGVLFLAIDVGDFFDRAPENLIVASELSSQVAFGIKVLSQKGIPL